MDERAALMRAVCENPDDDTPRLVFADWLQEHGDEARAEFIRIQIDASQRPQASGALRQRAKHLLSIHAEWWNRPLEGIGATWAYRRGFIEHGQMSPSEFLRCSDRVLAHTPLVSMWFSPQDDFRGFADCADLSRLRHVKVVACGPTSEDASVGELLGSRHLTGVRALDLAGRGDDSSFFASTYETLCNNSALKAMRVLNLRDHWLFDEPRRSALLNAVWLSGLQELELRDSGFDADAMQTLRERFKGTLVNS